MLVPLLCYAACLAFVDAMYAPIRRALRSVYGERFDALAPHNQQYCVKNVLKSGLLAAVLPFTVYVMVQRVAYGEVVFPEVSRTVGSLYAANDVVALARVRLPPNTRAHHTVVLVLSLLNLRLDYMSIHAHMLTELCALSMVPFVVNLHLGLRKLDGPLADALAPIGLLMYAPAVGLNVYRQSTAIRRVAADAPGTACVWTTFFAAIVLDDLFLMRHLLRSMLGGAETIAASRSSEEEARPRPVRRTFSLLACVDGDAHHHQQ